MIQLHIIHVVRVLLLNINMKKLEACAQSVPWRQHELRQRDSGGK